MPDTKKDAEAKPTVKDNPLWKRGDFRSDLERRPPLPRRFHCSVLGEDTIQSCSGTTKEVMLPDPKIERATVIELFLELSAEGKLLQWKNHFKMCEALCDTVAFMRKYDCERPLQILRMHVLNRLLLKQFAPLYVFMVAAVMDDIELSAFAFRHRFDASDIMPAGTVILPEMSGGVPPLDLVSLNARGGLDSDSTWPYQLWAMVSADFLWAASRAWNKAWMSQTVVNTRNHQPCSHGYGAYKCSGCVAKDKSEGKHDIDVDIAVEYEKAIGEVKKVQGTKQTSQAA